jgi:protein gp37
MGAKSKIEWCEHTFNPWVGCTKVSPACDHCYAATWAGRFKVAKWGPGEPRVRTTAANWRLPVKWDREAADTGTRPRVFCASLADVFDNDVPQEWRRDLFSLIDACRHLDWILLTKRIGNARDMLNTLTLGFWDMSPWKHVWIGATICNQDEADRDIPKLLAVPAALRFVSIEPMLGPIDLTRVCVDNHATLGTYLDALRGHRWDESAYSGGGPPLESDPPDFRGIDWVISGGESGPNARPAHPNWLRSLRDQCAAAGVPFLFKQWGEYIPGELSPHPDYPDDAVSAWRLDQRGRRWHNLSEGIRPMIEWEPVKFIKVGKKSAGRLLDGLTHNGFPSP